MTKLFILSPNYVASVQHIHVLPLRIHITVYFDTGRVFSASSVGGIRLIVGFQPLIVI